jgi:pimeloyl-ACP methyl ester carboxylesterase
MPAGIRRRTIEVCRFVASLVALAILQILFSAASQGAAADSCAKPVLRDSDEVWLVSSRGLGSCNAEQHVGKLKYWHYDREQSWTPAGLDALRATDSADAVTVVFVHGYRIDHCEAFTKGWSAYRALTRCAGERAVRFVIWSWPSAKTCGPIEDARMKAARTNADGYYLAWFVDQLGPQVPVSLWGHSYGARISTGALHLLGGGTLAGRQLSAVNQPEQRVLQAALLAAALDDDWLLSGRRNGQALPIVDGMLLVNNSCDRLLARYHWLYGRRCCQEALGYVGLAQGRLSAEQSQKVSQIDACCYVGSEHLFANYLASSLLMRRIGAQLLGMGQPATAPGNDVAATEVELELAAP